MELQEKTLAQISKNGRGYYGIGASAVPFSEELYTYLRITDINDDGTLNMADLKSVADENAGDYLLEPNDIVFARTGASTGRNYFFDGSDGQFVYAGFLIKFALDEKAVNPRFIKYYCMSKPYWDWISAYNTGSTRGNINAQTLASMPISLPPRDYQDKVVSILDSIESKRKRNNEINNNLFQQAQALFKARFVDLLPFNGEMPSNWRSGTVSEVIELHDSKRIPLSSRERAALAKVYPYYGATSIMDYVDRYLFDGIYLLLGEDGTVVDNAGYPILQYVEGKFWVNNHAHILTGKNGFSVELLYLLFSLTNVASIVTGAVQPKISQANLNKVPIIIPSIEELRMMDDQVHPMFAQIRNLRAENDRLATVRDTLLPKLMNGELDVSEVGDL